MKATDNMELDDLKKAWNMLDTQLRKEDIVKEIMVSELIAKCHTGAKSNIKQLKRKQKLSLWLGGSMIVLSTLFLLVVIPLFVSDIVIRQKANVMCIFFLLTLVVGIWWDFKTYIWIRDTKPDEMPVVEVIERISKFRIFTKYEVIAISIWVVVFTSLYYWVMSIWELSAFQQFVFITLLAVIDIFVIYLIYKKMIYNNLNDAEKNLKELKELQKNQ